MQSLDLDCLVDKPLFSNYELNPSELMVFHALKTISRKIKSGTGFLTWIIVNGLGLRGRQPSNISVAFATSSMSRLSSLDGALDNWSISKNKIRSYLKVCQFYGFPLLNSNYILHKVVSSLGVPSRLPISIANLWLPQRNFMSVIMQVSGSREMYFSLWNDVL